MTEVNIKEINAVIKYIYKDTIDTATASEVKTLVKKHGPDAIKWAKYKFMV